MQNAKFIEKKILNSFGNTTLNIENVKKKNDRMSGT